MRGDLEKKTTQLRKGILELAIMSSLFGNRHYGYSLVRVLTGGGVISLKEGTIYPILSRLAKEGLVQTEWVESSQGPPRKYYCLTENGRRLYEALIVEFRHLTALVNNAAEESNKVMNEMNGEKISLGREENDQ